MSGDELFFLCETNLDEVLTSADGLKPDVLIVDSVQTLFTEDKQASPGSVTQVKDCTMRLMQYCKSSGVTVFIVGHINKEGVIAGPKVLEHMVDCVLYFEGESHTSYRLLRAAKNRFGSTNEIGVFEMADTGLTEVPNPSEMLLSGRPLGTSGTCVACVMEGTRPILAEVQALVSPTTLSVPRRSCNGFDYNRAAMLLAVLEKRGGLHFSNADVYLNVIGGLRLDEPAADLPVLLAAASAYRDKPIADTMTAIGEVGLSGEIRSVRQLELRLTEIHRLGFTHCIIPRSQGRTRSAPRRDFGCCAREISARRSPSRCKKRGQAMPNLNYLMRVVRGARFDKMKPILETVKEKSGHSKARTFLSILWCSVRYGAGYYDYAMFGFYAMNGRQRDTYLTRMRNKKVLQAMNDYSYAEEFDDKNRFNKRFAPYLRRRTLNGETATAQELAAFCAGQEAIFAKPNHGDSGRGVEKLRVADFPDAEAMLDYLHAHGLTVLEQVLAQHPQIAALHPSSVNTLRILTDVVGEDVI